MRAALRIARIAARAAPSAPRTALPRVAFPAVALPSTSASSFPSVRTFSSTPIALKKGGKEKGGGKKADKSGKKKKDKDEDEESGLTEAEVDGIVEKTKGKMTKSIEWAKGVIFEGVERGRGRVSPALLDPIKVAIPEQGSQPLKALASVTVSKNSLVIEAWDAGSLKHIEGALHRANLPGMSPQRDGTLIRIPVSKPTADVRTKIVKSMGETTEAAKNQLRQARTDGIKALGGKGEAGADELQDALEAGSHEIDKLLQTAKKELEKA